LSNPVLVSEDIADDISEELLENSNTILDIKNCGDSLGSFNGVTAYYNDGFSTCDDSGRHQNQDGYVYGKKWQCVEYVRRYYKDALNHEMPEYWGHATDYFLVNIPSGSMNLERDLLQHHNGDVKPQKNDILIWPGTYGHVAIVTNVTETTVSTIAQNVGQNCTEVLSLNEYTISGGCVGLLRKQTIQD
jgi:surface antigen